MMDKKEYNERLLELKKQCGFWGRGYVNYGKFNEGYERLRKEFNTKVRFMKNENT